MIRVNNFEKNRSFLAQKTLGIIWNTLFDEIEGYLKLLPFLP